MIYVSSLIQYDTNEGSINADGSALEIKKIIDFIERENCKKSNESFKVIYPMEHPYVLVGEFKIIFSGPCTVLFVGKQKTVVRCEGEKFSYKKGGFMAFLKYALPKKQWNRLLDSGDGSIQTLSSMIKILYGEDVYDGLMKAVKDGRAKNKDNDRC